MAGVGIRRQTKAQLTVEEEIVGTILMMMKVIM